MNIDPATLTISTAREHLISGDFSVQELTAAYLGEIEKKNEKLNAYREVFADARKQAEVADSQLKNFTRAKRTALPHLFGAPLAVKDNILIEGRHVGASSRMLENYIASYDATGIKKLKAQGVVFLGRTNMDEFAMGSSTETSAYGVTRNPHDEARVAGGSSGGSAAAVAADLALAALGSDTGGSIRQPAALCGVVGLKPTYGSVSRSGLMAMSSSLDVIGPFAKTVSDAESVFNAIKGRDPLDSTSIELSAQKTPVELRIGIPRLALESEGIDQDVRANFDESIDKLKKAGCEVTVIDLPSLKYSLPAYYIIMPAEVSTNLARFDGVKYGLHASGANLLEDYLKTRAQGFGLEARRRILLGTYVLSSGYYDAYYAKAVSVRRLIREELRGAFARAVDALVMPTSPTPAFKIGEKTADPLSMYLADIFTVTANIGGIPALSVPSGRVVRDGKRLPLGLQFMAAEGREDILFALGRHFERASKEGWYN